MRKIKNNSHTINIDGRMLYNSGIGRCLREILKEIVIIDKNIKVFLYCQFADYERFINEYSINSEQVSFKNNNSSIYSIKEQLLGSLISIKNTDNGIFYYPHYNLPYIIPKNSVFTIHDFTQFKFPEYFGKSRIRFAKFILNNAVKKARKIIVVSNATALDFYKYFPEFKAKVEVVHNGLSDKFRKLGEQEKSIFLKRTGLVKYILFIGNNKSHKNIQGLVEAFVEVKKEFEELKLLIISNGFEPKNIYSEKIIRDDIIVINNVSDEELVYYYNCACMLVLPSFYEGFGLPIIEAMACGCPVVASDLSSLPEICGDAAVLVNPYNNKNIAEGIKILIKDTGFKNTIIEKGYVRSQEFSWNKTASKYLKIFEKLAS